MPISPVAKGVRAMASPTPSNRMRIAARVWLESIEATGLPCVEGGEAFAGRVEAGSEHRVGLAPRPDDDGILCRSAVGLSGEVERPRGQLVQLRAGGVVRGAVDRLREARGRDRCGFPGPARTEGRESGGQIR